MSLYIHKTQLYTLQKKYANCTDVENSRRHIDDGNTEVDTKVFNVDLGRHLRDPDDYTARRSNNQGGFCEVNFHF